MFCKRLKADWIRYDPGLLYCLLYAHHHLPALTYFLLHPPLTTTAATDDDYTVHGMANLMLVEFILCVIPLTLTVIFFKDQPPTAPSKSTKLKIDVSLLVCYYLFHI